MRLRQIHLRVIASASEAIQQDRGIPDCFVAALLAMTLWSDQPQLSGF
jgi:hypothetical protein